MKKLLSTIPVLLFLLSSYNLFGQVNNNLIPFDESYKRKYHTVKLEGTPPVIDGKLDDACWKDEGSWSQDFIQNTPVERGKASNPTKIKILFDDKNIYFALRAWDPEPNKINH